MKTLGFFIITMLSGEVWVTDNPVECDHAFAMTDDHKRLQIARTFCDYTAAPITSPMPIANPWREPT
jgi:hypothetical protein